MAGIFVVAPWLTTRDESGATPLHLAALAAHPPEAYAASKRDLRGTDEHVVAICGDLMTMPGLPRQPAAELMSVDVDGNIHGLS